MNYVGIDLGTSNSSLSYFDDETIVNAKLEQLESKAKTICKTTLASCLYLTAEDEFNSEDLSMSFGKNEYVGGDFAKSLGSQNPKRFISSAKSWLCQTTVARDEKILPFNSDISHKISPVEASTAYLQHMIKAAGINTSEKVTLTVPASFDEVSRELTLKSAKDAGISQAHLLEEPLAAFYSWISENEESWRESLEAGDLVVVCDVGGGTCDFSLIHIKDNKGKLELERISVGDHLLLGGDNMDLALALKLKLDHEKTSKKLDQWQFQSLVYQVKSAKEKLLGSSDLEEVKISVSSRGSAIFGSSVSFSLRKDDVEAYLTSSFFPVVDKETQIEGRGRAGLQRVGLQYETDPSISKHFVEFLRNSSKKINIEANSELSKRLEGGLLLPNKILFNGGVFKSKAIRDSFMVAVKSLFAGDFSMLEGANYELAVARGAAYFSKLNASGEGIKIKAGTSKSYYIGVESNQMAIPGFSKSLDALCVVEKGTEEGSFLEVSQSNFCLLTGEMVTFRFFSAEDREEDKLGDLIESGEDFLEETSQLSALCEIDCLEKGNLATVSLATEIDDLGQMKIYIYSKKFDKKWKLDFDLRAYEK